MRLGKGSTYLHESRCPQCQAQASWLFNAIDVNRHIRDKQFTYFRCRYCGLVFLHPVPENLSEYYPDAYYDTPPTGAVLAERAEIERFKLDILRAWAPATGRLLEIGPAYGTFAYLAKTDGWEVEAIEADPRCCRFLCDVIGVKARLSSQPHVESFPADSLNAVALWQVIEHLPDPWDTLAACAKWLRPGGIVIIATPNPSAFQFKLFGPRWTHLDAPRHLWLLPQELIRKRAMAVGLATVFVTASDRGTRGWNSFGWRVSLQNLVQTGIGKRMMRMLALVLRVVLAPFETSVDTASAYVIVLQKTKAS